MFRREGSVRSRGAQTWNSSFFENILVDADYILVTYRGRGTNNKTEMFGGFS
jgi:hypothetical protein